MTAADLPAGWSETPTNPHTEASLFFAGCSAPNPVANGGTNVSVSFGETAADRSVGEALAAWPTIARAQAAVTATAAAVDRCPTGSAAPSATTNPAVTGTLSAAALGVRADQTDGWTTRLAATTGPRDGAIVLLREGSLDAEVVYQTAGVISMPTLQGLVRAAAVALSR